MLLEMWVEVKMHTYHARAHITVGVGTVIIPYIGLAFARGGGYNSRACKPPISACFMLHPHRSNAFLLCNGNRGSRCFFFRESSWEMLKVA